MSRMTFTVPPELKARAQAQADVNWSAVVAQAIERRLDFFERLETFASTSTLTQKDVDEIAASIDKSMAKRHRKLFASSLTPTES